MATTFLPYFLICFAIFVCFRQTLKQEGTFSLLPIPSEIEKFVSMRIKLLGLLKMANYRQVIKNLTVYLCRSAE